MAYDRGSSDFSDVNFLRLLLGDVDATYIAFTDTELGALITLHTEDGVIAWDVCVGWCLRVLSVDPGRLWTIKRAMGGGISLSDLMDVMWQRAEKIFA